VPFPRRFGVLCGIDVRWLIRSRQGKVSCKLWKPVLFGVLACLSDLNLGGWWESVAEEKRRCGCVT
jgi:hypothetical protein